MKVNHKCHFHPEHQITHFCSHSTSALIQNNALFHSAQNANRSTLHSTKANTNNLSSSHSQKLIEEQHTKLKIFSTIIIKF